MSQNTQPSPESQSNPQPQASTGGVIPGQDNDPNASGNPEAGSASIPASTQENMGDGAGIRGSYGDASQTNGLEGGPQTEPDDLTRRGTGD